MEEVIKEELTMSAVPKAVNYLIEEVAWKSETSRGVVIQTFIPISKRGKKIPKK